MLTDEHWSKLRPTLLQQGIYDKVSLRTTAEGILYRMRMGCQWWGVWALEHRLQALQRLVSGRKTDDGFHTLVEDPDVEWLFINGSYIKAHQDSTGAATEETEAIGKSRAGNTSKIHLVVDAYGLPNCFRITGVRYTTAQKPRP